MVLRVPHHLLREGAGDEEKKRWSQLFPKERLWFPRKSVSSNKQTISQENTENQNSSIRRGVLGGVPV